MADTKFTPAPWRVSRGTNEVITGSGKHICVASLGVPVGEPCQELDTRLATMHANASLIASAPDLYRALDFFVNAIGHRHAGWEEISDAMLSTAEGTALDDALAAMARARGEAT